MPRLRIPGDVSSGKRQVRAYKSALTNQYKKGTQYAK